jgi:SnoaL-like domain
MDDFEDTAAELLAKFRRLWQLRDPAVTFEIVAPDVVARWSGSGVVRGDEYPERWRSLVIETFDDLEFEITGHAAEDPFLFISWHVRATLGSEAAEGDGVDRFHIRGNRVDEVLVIFDTAPMAELLSRGSATPHQRA